jgi:hypothetical protein
MREKLQKIWGSFLQSKLLVLQNSSISTYCYVCKRKATPLEQRDTRTAAAAGLLYLRSGLQDMFQKREHKEILELAFRKINSPK